jgi:cell shape-determining protein MreC
MRKPSRRTVITILLFAGLAMSWLPSGLSDGLKNTVGPVFSPFCRVSRLVRLHAVHGWQRLKQPPVTKAEYERLLKKMRSIEGENTQLKMQVRQDRWQIECLTGLRKELVGPQSCIVPAAVVAEDSGWLRESVLLDAGERRGVSAGQWVLSMISGKKEDLQVNAGEKQGVGVGQWVLAARRIVGRVQQVGPYTCRVRLLTDPASRVQALILIPEKSGKTRLLDCLLEGLGNGRMIARKLPANEDIQTGQNVLLKSAPSLTPAGMIIGRIDRIKKNEDNLLLVDAEVVPLEKIDEVKELYVVVPPSGEQGDD